jgi:hypothetical protein
MNCRFGCVIVALVLLTAPVYAQNTLGELTQLCQDHAKQFEQLECLAYIRGFHDALTLATISALMDATEQKATPTPTNFERFVSNCIPSSVTVGQIQKIIVKYAGDHPELLHREAGVMLLRLLRESFPCKGKQ